ncbi:hypothetical protein BH23CHL2_BH23CHL2_33270 [soil metagenome]
MQDGFKRRIQLFVDLDELIEAVLHEWWDDPARLQQLTAYKWWRTGVHDVMTLSS